MTLLPCPFCSGKAVLRHQIASSQGGGDEVFVECKKCECRTREFDEYDGDDYKKQAVALWNSRADSRNVK